MPPPSRPRRRPSAAPADGGKRRGQRGRPASATASSASVAQSDGTLSARGVDVTAELADQLAGVELASRRPQLA
eukprot:3367726-Prymnesium_polylepis.1